MRKVHEAARRLGLEGRELVLAVSGGADSVAMALAFHAMRDALGSRLVIGTVDHGLREGSAEDARFVMDLAASLGIEGRIARVTIARSGNLEAMARDARYRALREIAGPDVPIATAHTLDDQAETVLMRLARGAGLSGLGGIRETREGIVRPMLSVRRVEVEAWLRERGVVPRVDPTNASDDFLRNRVRHELMPVFARVFGEAGAVSVARSASVAAEDAAYLDGLAWSALDAANGEVAKLLALPSPLRRRALRRLVTEVEPGAGRALDRPQLERLERALGVSAPVRLRVSGGVEVRVRYGRIEAGPPPAPEPPPAPVRVEGPGEWRFGATTVSVRKVEGPGTSPRGGLRLDPARLALPLTLRARRPGDRFRPLGGHEKKLKAFLIDMKVPREQRDGLPLLVDATGTVLWLVGRWPSNARRDGEAALRAWELTVSV